MSIQTKLSKIIFYLRNQLAIFFAKNQRKQYLQQIPHKRVDDHCNWLWCWTHTSTWWLYPGGSPDDHGLLCTVPPIQVVKSRWKYWRASPFYLCLSDLIRRKKNVCANIFIILIQNGKKTERLRFYCCRKSRFLWFVLALIA